ncbi:MAG: protein-L-isoaspartate(D-aspartate) O-methyltransferase [Dehalococcoidia bacterium]|nr:MAG: protein-L-isoaspartate(D-aspartate) O-methyltransferase [Dehalococcoidia bacterium]
MNLEREREKLIEHLRQEISDERVLNVMARVPRELFVPSSSRHLAYEDRPLPIGEGQTISQPFIIALMTQALELLGSEKVLELGTGSGYQAAILAEIARQVITVERLPSLANTARRTLKKLGYINVQVHLAERTLGRRAEAPYDAIMVTAAAPRIPQELLDQLAVGGRLVIPVGSRWEQDLLQVTKQKEEFTVKNLTPCRFVPLIGEEAWNEE